MSNPTVNPEPAVVELEGDAAMAALAGISPLGEEDRLEARTGQIIIDLDVTLPTFPTLKAGTAYSITLVHTLSVRNNDQQDLEGYIEMSHECPGVFEGAKTWRQHFRVKRDEWKGARYPTTADVKPEQAGQFTYTGRTSWYGESTEKQVTFEVED